MTIKPHYLEIKTSQIPGAGLGLFTKIFIPCGSLVIEYKGVVTTWEAVKEEIDNDYIYYISSRHVINARPTLKALARYANDAKGMKQVEGINNNCTFKKMEGRVYIKARVDILAGTEIFVSYGKQYWDTAKNNEAIAKRRELKKKKEDEGL
jgi:SET domain-containing protein